MPAFLSLLSSFDLLPWTERVPGRPLVGFLAHVVIGGVDFHAIAMPVEMQGGFQLTLDDENEDELANLYLAWEPGSPFTTAKVKGYDCVVTFQPYAE